MVSIDEMRVIKSEISPTSTILMNKFWIVKLGFHFKFSVNLFTPALAFRCTPDLYSSG